MMTILSWLVAAAALALTITAIWVVFPPYGYPEDEENQ